MLITFQNGDRVEGILLSQSSDHLRVALKDWDDAVEFTRIRGVWISEFCEPVRIEMEWERVSRPAEVTEADCICPPELAARLIHALVSGEDEVSPALWGWQAWMAEPLVGGYVV